MLQPPRQAGGITTPRTQGIAGVSTSSLLCKTSWGGWKMILHPLFARLRASLAPPQRVRCGQAVRACAAGGQELGEPVQIRGDHAQPNPAFHAGAPVIATAIQPVAPFEPTDPPCNPGTPGAPGPQPVLLLVSAPCGRLLAGLGQPHLRDAALLSIAFVGGSIQPPVTGQQVGWMPKLLEMRVQTR